MFINVGNAVQVAMMRCMEKSVNYSDCMVMKNYGMIIKIAALPAAAAILSVPPAPALPCRIFSTPTMARPANGAGSGLPATWTATPIWPAATLSDRIRGSECALRFCIKSTTTNDASASTCASAVDVVMGPVPSAVSPLCALCGSA